MTLGELKEPTEGERVAQKMREKWYNVPVNLKGEKIIDMAPSLQMVDNAALLSHSNKVAFLLRGKVPIILVLARMLWEIFPV